MMSESRTMAGGNRKAFKNRVGKINIYIMESLGLDKFQANSLTESEMSYNYGADTCTGGGFSRLGPDCFLEWESDTADDQGGVTYHNCRLSGIC